jgi:hypothetical protein
MKLTLEERLNQIIGRITSREFLDSKGLGNEIGFWIFDYPPDREMDVRDFLAGTVLPALAKKAPSVRAETVNLLTLVSEILEERNLLEKAMAMQQAKGDDATLAALRSVLKEDKLAQKIADACQGVGIQFTWAYDTTGTKHDRDITTDTGWKIVLSRGLDIFQRFELNDAFNFANRLQEYRQCKEFNVTYVRMNPRDDKS